jgi:cytochrome c peroxidase
VTRTTLTLLGLAACSWHSGTQLTDGRVTDTRIDDAPIVIDAVTPIGSAMDPSGYGNSSFANGFQPNNPFFLVLGTNGRTCASCHVQATGWTLSPPEVQARFTASNGLDPLFRLVDGASSPNADVSTLPARQSAYSMLLTYGVLRIGIGVPAGADYTLMTVVDPYNYASASQLSLFRRPLPSTNLKFETALMWDGREPSLMSQATDATMGHAQATSVNATQMQDIVAFESSIATTQVLDSVAGALDAAGATGGLAALGAQTFTAGENDPFAGSPGNYPSFENVFDLYTAWGSSVSATPEQAAVARGEVIFNTTTFFITSVAGLNDVTGQSDIQGTCSLCHNATNAGDLSSASVGLMDIGVSTQAPGSDQPVYTFKRTSDGTTVQTTDPGEALVTGKFADMNKFKTPTLRGLAMRAPYFHDGIAATLADVVTFYNSRFDIDLTAQQQSDLVAFLQSL